MCLPGCHEVLATAFSRRSLFRGAGAGAALLATAPVLAPRRAAAQATRSFTRVVDLTHTLSPDFPTFFGQPQLEIRKVFELEKDGFNLNEWLINEHTGTHIDTPRHFSDGPSVDALPVDSLVVPLAVIDIRERAAADADAQVTPDDITAWEAANGPLPEGAAVAMLSGWDAHVATDKFRNADAEGRLHFPGFHPDSSAALAEKGVNGVVVDTLSLDYGASPDFAFHYQWLGSGHWGIEAAARLDAVPASGATLVVGAPTVQGATGGPSRVIALI